MWQVHHPDVQYPAALPNDIGKSCTSFRRKRPTSCYDFVDGQSSSRPCPMRCEEQEEDCLGCCQRGGRHNTWHACRNCNPWIGLEAKENWTSFRQKRHAPAPDKAGRRHYSCKPLMPDSSGIPSNVLVDTFPDTVVPDATTSLASDDSFFMNQFKHRLLFDRELELRRCWI